MLITVTEIAKRLAVPVWRGDFYVRTRNLEPADRVAEIRLFDETIVLDVAKGLAQMRRKRGPAETRGGA